MVISEPAGEVLDPCAEDLIQSLRAFGYDLPTALADLIDNSIAAGATTVRIAHCSDPGVAWVGVLDDGRGMSEDELRDAMRFARDPNAARTANDLGRFGLGLKTASLSHVRRVTVLTRKHHGTLSARTWDIDHVSEQRQWRVITELDEGAAAIAEQLGFTGQGTLVLWRKTDRLGDRPGLSRRINEAGRELSLLFHRFVERGRLTLYLGGRVLSPMDPYLRRHPATQDRGFEDLEHGGHRIRLNPVVLPHPSRLSRSEMALASGPGGMQDRQGFYVYRGDRLVVAGGWLGLPGLHKSQPTRLARVAVDIPPEADLVWEVDVRKSTVRPPSMLERRMAEIARDVRARSERVFAYRGAPTARARTERDIHPVWHQVRRRGVSEYVVNREHPLVAAVLAGPNGEALEGVLHMVETTLPVETISQEILSSAQPNGSTAKDSADVEEVLATFRAMLAGLPKDPETRSVLLEALTKAEPFATYPGLIQEVIESEEN
ncbi:ATP-binding protein [Nonomuraea typhae]|uniref:ATP-binding protein n=1 Tax=Nonomuraea typhae TaxID=2603600 RepID=A0ABW7ZCI2_9ACTN